jgi:hypothetical protein
MTLKRISQIAFLSCSLLFFANLGFADSFTWFEAGSAGNLPATANVTSGAGPLSAIQGNLSSLTEVDMYQIRITDFTQFSATTQAGPNFVDDPQLFLFTAAGLAVYMNDDAPGLGSQSMLPSGSPFGPTANGLYYLAIGWWDNEAFSAAGRMFEDGTETNGPSVGGQSPITSWNNDVTGRPDLPTAYRINLTGAAFAVVPVPEPSTVILFASGLVGLLGLKLRRSKYREERSRQ